VIEGAPHLRFSAGKPPFFEWCGQRPSGLNTVGKWRVAGIPHGRSVHPDKRMAPRWYRQGARHGRSSHGPATARHAGSTTAARVRHSSVPKWSGTACVAAWHRRAFHGGVTPSGHAGRRSASARHEKGAAPSGRAWSPAAWTAMGAGS